MLAYRRLHPLVDKCGTHLGSDVFIRRWAHQREADEENVLDQ